MTNIRESDNSPEPSEYTPHRVRLPGFISEQEIGLGDAITKATSYLGIKPCGGCQQRANALNNWMVFTK